MQVFLHFCPLHSISHKPRLAHSPTLKSHVLAPYPPHRIYFAPPRARTRDTARRLTHQQAVLIPPNPHHHTLLNTNTRYMKPYVPNLLIHYALHYLITPFPHHTPRYHPKFGYKDNTKTEKIQIFLHYFFIFFVS